MDIKKQNPYKLSILIVNYKQDKEIKELVKFLLKNKTFNFEILVFNNSKSLKIENIKTYSVNRNIGYGSAINFLSTKAKASNLLILNPDIKITDNITNAFNEYLNTGIKYGIYSLGGFDLLYQLPLLKLKKAKRFSSYAFFINKDLFKSVGGFDPNYFMYFEDDDLFLRLKELNIKTYYPKKSYVTHLKSYKNISYKRRKKYYYKSLLFFLKRHKKHYYYIFYIPIKLKLLLIK